MHQGNMYIMLVKTSSGEFVLRTAIGKNFFKQEIAIIKSFGREIAVIFSVPKSLSKGMIGREIISACVACQYGELKIGYLMKKFKDYLVE